MNVIVVTSPGPQGSQGPQGPQGDVGPSGSVGPQGPQVPTGSFATTGSNVFIGNEIITGSLMLSSGSSLFINDGFYINNNKQFNYGAFSDTTIQTLAAGISGSFTYNTTDVYDGVLVLDNSRLTVPATGVYNIQFSSQLLANANNTIVYIWLKKNNQNVTNTATRVFLRNNEEAVAAWNWVLSMNANDYAEIAWQSNNGNASLQYFAANGNIPAVPSIIVTVTQVA